MPRKFRTGDQALVRALNRSILLNLLRMHSPQSRADLAVATGLNKATVSSLIADLIESGPVREIGPASSAGGRPAVMLELNSDAGWIIGVELGVWYVKVILTDFRASVLWRNQIVLEPQVPVETALSTLIDLVADAAEVADRAGRQVFGLGVAIAGLLDVRTGVLLFGQNAGWHNVSVLERLKEVFPFPVFVDNDAKAATIGEKYFGRAQHIDDFVHMTANTGLGVGVWLDGRVYRGAVGFAGEVGHTTFIPDGRLCSCGNRGCWETYASQKALLQDIRERVAAGGTTRLPTVDDRLGDVTMPMIVEAARAGDRLVLSALDEVGDCLGLMVANLINTFNPTMLVFGGVLSMAAEFLLPPIERVVAERAIPWAREATEIVVSSHRYDGCVMGAVALVLHDMLSHPRLDLPVQKPPFDRRHSKKGGEA
jgi:glucokinase-like ROK family protein